MRRIRSAVIVGMSLSSMSLASCNRVAEDKAPNHAPCQVRICSLLKTAAGNHQKFTNEIQCISNQIMEMTNAYERLIHYRLLARELLAFDFDALTPGQRELMCDKYTPPFYGLLQRMVDDGASEREICGLVVSEFKKFRELCFPTNLCYYAEEDRSLEARQHRAYAKGLVSRWENDLLIWERVYVPHVLDRYSNEATRRFLTIWRKEFGSHEKSAETKSTGSAP